MSYTASAFSEGTKSLVPYLKESELAQYVANLALKAQTLEIELRTYKETNSIATVNTWRDIPVCDAVKAILKHMKMSLSVVPAKPEILELVKDSK